MAIYCFPYSSSHLGCYRPDLALPIYTKVEEEEEEKENKTT